MDSKIPHCISGPSAYTGRQEACMGGYKFSKGTRVHRLVWTNHNGAIPEGSVVHHKNGIKDDNRIENLELMTLSEHASLHAPDTRVGRLKGLPKMLEAARLWHKGPAGKDWHKKNYQLTKDRLHAKKPHVCEQCGKEYESNRVKDTKFCSGKCKTAHRYHSGIDNELRQCSVCGSPFEVNRYTIKPCCGPACSYKLRKVQTCL